MEFDYWKSKNDDILRIYRCKGIFLEMTIRTKVPKILFEKNPKNSPNPNYEK
jgi:hypothetical protein